MVVAVAPTESHARCRERLVLVREGCRHGSRAESIARLARCASPRCTTGLGIESGPLAEACSQKVHRTTVLARGFLYRNLVGEYQLSTRFCLGLRPKGITMSRNAIQFDISPPRHASVMVYLGAC